MGKFLQFLEPDFLVLLGLWFLAFLFLVRIAFRQYERVHECHWYGQSDERPSERMKWCQIRSMIENDPLKFHKTSKKLCRCPCKLFLFDSFRLIALLFIAFGSLIFVFHWTLPDDAFCSPVLNEFLCSIEISRAGNLGLTVAGAATLIAAVITVFYQIRIQARSKNRQNWINSIREEMTVLMSNFPTCDASEREIETAQQKTRVNITRLSLSLNPSECVHRGFLAIIRFMYRIDGLEEDQKARDELQMDVNIFQGTHHDCPEQRKRLWSAWNSKAMRLANILLKREWVQVKHVR